jgi:hypothetical protein
MLMVSALQLGNPMLFFVLVKSGNATVHQSIVADKWPISLQEAANGR